MGDSDTRLGQDLLDGLLWHSAGVEDGRVRVNYYIRELLGNPQARTHRTRLARTRRVHAHCNHARRLHARTKICSHAPSPPQPSS